MGKSRTDSTITFWPDHKVAPRRSLAHFTGSSMYCSPAGNTRSPTRPHMSTTGGDLNSLRNASHHLTDDGWRSTQLILVQFQPVKDGSDNRGQRGRLFLHDPDLTFCNSSVQHHLGHIDQMLALGHPKFLPNRPSGGILIGLRG